MISLCLGGEEGSEAFLPQHVGHDEESHMTPPDVYLIQMADATIARGNGYILELYIHVVFCLDQFATIHLPRGDLERHDMVLR